MDRTSLTIDRHTPTLPESVWEGLPPAEEQTWATIKNRIILPGSHIDAVVKSSRQPPKKTYQRHITQEYLNSAREALTTGPIGKPLRELLERGITPDEVARYQMQGTAELADRLGPEVAAALSLRLPPNLPKPHEIEGVSIPHFSGDLLLGFCTWVRNNPQVKYAFSAPHRFAFGHDPSQPEVWVVEGVFDAIALARTGRNVLAMGDSQPNYFKMLVASRYPKINLLFDDDLSGSLGCIKAHILLTTMLGRADADIAVWGTTGGLDPERSVVLGRTDFLRLTYREALERLDHWVAYRETNNESIRA